MSIRSLSRRPALALLMSLLAVACSDAPSAPSAPTASTPAPSAAAGALTGPGPIILTMRAPNADDGAVVVAIQGGPLDSVTAAGRKVYAARAAQTDHRVLLTDALVSGPIAVLWVPDRAAAMRYTLTLAEVSAAGTYTLRDPRAYTLALLSARP